ncbi:MAG: hypothetical protein ABSF90_15115, partial [Syntrophobacteraceae bacterium]
TPPRGDAVTFGYREWAPPERGLAPLRSRLLPGALIPAKAGLFPNELILTRRPLTSGPRTRNFRGRLRRGDVYRVFRPDVGIPMLFITMPNP